MKLFDPILANLRGLFPAACHDRIFPVGGCVRDLLLDREIRDIDLVALVSDDLLRSLRFRPVTGKTTAPIWFRHDDVFGVIEVTQLAVDADLADDLLRRDFTINAMAATLQGEIIDPLHGRDDLQHGILRACSPLVFRDDPLRIFRAFRFEADGWRMEAATGTLIRERDWSDYFRAIPVERFSREMCTALAARDPARFFRRMFDFAVGAEYLPEIFMMPDVPAGPPEHHPEGDLFSHSVQVLERVAAATSEPLPRFCGFFHDLGKLSTPSECYPRHHGHDEAGFVRAREFCTRLRLPASFRTALSWTSRLHGTANKWDELRLATRVRMAGEAIKAGITAILPAVSAADKARGNGMPGWEDAVRVAGMTTAELGIDPERLAAMPVAHRPLYILQSRVEMLRSMGASKE
jgi:tRNA nucleotidyltransferase (CCA-adding enzyme)